MALVSALAEVEAEPGGVGQLTPLEASAVDRLREERENCGECVGKAQVRGVVHVCIISRATTARGRNSVDHTMPSAHR